jgi:aspartate/tyrosine/aromatic aminotransferase
MANSVSQPSSGTNSGHPRRFAHIQTAPPDPILGIGEAFAADPNPNKMNLSVGVYQDQAGKTPILESVKRAETILLESEKSKGYLSIEGLPDYRAQVAKLSLGDRFDFQRVAVVQTPGGTSAVRLAADFVADQLGIRRVWMSSPTWANHQSIFQAAGVATENYRYLNAEKTRLDFNAMCDSLRTQTSRGDAVLLHACCHNPTGIDPTSANWQVIADILAERELFPIVDFAYQGFGDGIEEDAIGIRTLLGTVGEAIICSSFSKNFGLYSERVGALVLVSANANEAIAAHSQLKRLVRSNYSNPPRHGGAIVATILADPTLTRLWRNEVDAMRDRITRLRAEFVQGMRRTGVDRDFSFLLDQKGMFSYSGLSAMQADELRNRYGIYIVGSGRINVAGISEARLDNLCSAVADVVGNTRST